MNRTSKQPLLFLTGCINPNGMMQTKLQDPEIRKSQYIDSIRFYLKNTNAPILFVENSGIDISDEFVNEKHSGRLEIICFQGNDYPKDLGKGYGEMLIIEYALKNSSLIRNNDFIFKITGRYKILNINSFIDHYNSASLDLLVDLKNELRYADSRLIGCSVAFLSEILIGYKNQLNDSKMLFFEHILCKATHDAIIKDFKFSFFKYKPRYSGTYGTDNTVYNDSWLYWFPRNIKYRLRYKLSL